MLVGSFPGSLILADASYDGRGPMTSGGKLVRKQQEVQQT